MWALIVSVSDPRVTRRKASSSADGLYSNSFNVVVETTIDCLGIGTAACVTVPESSLSILGYSSTRTRRMLRAQQLYTRMIVQWRRDEHLDETADQTRLSDGAVEAWKL